MQKNCPKRAEFHSKNKFETLVQLVVGGKIETNETGRACGAYGGG